jgi:hypothetical protein
VTEKPASLAEALAAFQANPPRVAKDTQGNRGKYADLADLSPVVLPALAAHGLSWSTKPTLTEQGMFVLRYTLRHVSGQEDSGDYPLCDPSSAPQVIGSCITYARRYALTAVTGVAPGGDDDDADRATTQHTAQRPPSQRSESLKPTAKAAKAPEKPELTPLQQAARFVAALLDAATVLRAEAGAAAVERATAIKELDVTKILTVHERETLDIRDGDTVSLTDLSGLVVNYVADHKASVRAAQGEAA